MTIDINTIPAMATTAGLVIYGCYLLVRFIKNRGREDEMPVTKAHCNQRHKESDEKVTGLREEISKLTEAVSELTVAVAALSATQKERERQEALRL